MKLVSQRLHIQARNAIINFIEKDLVFMDKLPSEQELSERLEVSRGTIREALRSLERDGIINTRHGIGTFYIGDKKNLKTNISVLESSTKVIADQGYTPGTEGTYSEIMEAPAKIASILNLADMQKVFYIERIRTADSMPVVYVKDYIPYMEGMQELYTRDSFESLFDFLLHLGHKISFASCNITAVMSDTEVEKKLSLSKTNAILLLEQTHFSVKGMPILYSDSYYLSDKFEFSIIRKNID